VSTKSPSAQPSQARPKKPKTQIAIKDEPSQQDTDINEFGIYEYQIRPTRTRNITPSISRFDPSITRMTTKSRTSNSINQEPQTLSGVRSPKSSVLVSSPAPKKRSSSAKSLVSKALSLVPSEPSKAVTKSISDSKKPTQELPKPGEIKPRSVLRGLVFNPHDGLDEQDTACNVCFNPESYEEDEILFCDRCNVAVHQSCYGVRKIPDGQWFCDRCRINGAATAVCLGFG
jgi:hypothetical protein